MQRCSRQASTSSSIRSNDAGAYTQRIRAKRIAAIREDDSKGRYTTTFRSLKILPQGGLLMDTPGMREQQLAECEQGVSETFSEIIALAEQCRFNDCTHNLEPNCAVQKAIRKVELSPRRFSSYKKLMKEQAFNSSTLSEKKAQDKSWVKMISRVQIEAQNRKKRH